VASRTPCTLPADHPAPRELRCFTVALLGYEFGAHEYQRASHLVFDAATGARLGPQDLHGWTEPDLLAELVADLVCVLRGCWPVTLRDGQLVPPAAGLQLEFSPYEIGPSSEGTQRLTLPWDLVARVRDAAADPGATRSA
jgi:hypothetical protein